MTPGERRPGRSLGVGVVGAVGLWSALALLAQPGWCAEARRPNLQGAWKLNPDLTARLAKDQQEREQAEGGEGGARGHHSAGPGLGGPQGDLGLGGDPSATAKDRDPAQGLAGLLASFDALTIAQQTGQVTITDLHGHSRILKTDGSKVRDAAAPGGPVQLRASWDRDDGLLVEVKADNGVKHTESYIVSNDGKHLYLTLTTDRNSQILRAYDLAPAAPAPDHQATQTPSPPGGATPPAGPPPS